MSDENSFTLVGLGKILWDMLPAGRQLGGAPANFAYHAQGDKTLKVMIDL